MILKGVSVMELNEKIALIEECMDVDPGSIEMEDELENFEEWDSVTALSVIAMVDERFHKTLTGEDLKKAKKVKDLISLME